ncbi:MAG: IS481 family transposase [Homoserinimonas sp.]
MSGGHHRNAPLTIEGRRRLIERCQARPIAHVASEMRISRATASKWVNRYKQFGDLGLQDRSSTPQSLPTATDGTTIARIEQMRRDHKWSASRIEFELAQQHVEISRRTVTRVLAQLGLNRRRFIDPTGESNREPQRIIAKRPGHMVHIDVKKVGRIPNGGGWRVHGRESAQARAVDRGKRRDTRPSYVYLHSAVDGNTRLAYTEALNDEKGTTAAGFLDRAKAWFANHGITSIERIVTDNGACYRSKVFADTVLPARQQRIKPYTPRHNGKVERYNRILAEEFLYARTWLSEQERADALVVWDLHYNYHRPHGAHHGRPPASIAPLSVHNVLASYN